jgi:hypothetical protein
VEKVLDIGSFICFFFTMFTSLCILLSVLGTWLLHYKVYPIGYSNILAMLIKIAHRNSRFPNKPIQWKEQYQMSWVVSTWRVFRKVRTSAFATVTKLLQFLCFTVGLIVRKKITLPLHHYYKWCRRESWKKLSQNQLRLCFSHILGVFIFKL